MGQLPHLQLNFNLFVIIWIYILDTISCSSISIKKKIMPTYYRPNRSIHIERSRLDLESLMYESICDLKYI